MKKSKWLKVLVVIGVIALIGISSTVAYFTGASQSSANVFTTGTLAVEIDQDSPLDITNVSPGDVYQLEFDIRNTGTSPIFVKGYLDGSWDDESLSTQVVSLTAIEIENQGTSYSISQFGEAMGTEFLITAPDQIGMLEIPGGQTVKIFMDVKFSSAMENDYQGKSLSLALHLGAKQTQAGTDWPSEF